MALFVVGCSPPAIDENLRLLSKARDLRDSGDFASAVDYLTQIDTAGLGDSARWACTCLYLETSRHYNQAKLIRQTAPRCYLDALHSTYYEPYARFNYYMSMAQAHGIEHDDCTAWRYLDSAVTNLEQNNLPLGQSSAQGMLDELLKNVEDPTTVDLHSANRNSLAQKFCP
mgnify:CR=1 FL=1